jgi:hypothetical protein
MKKSYIKPRIVSWAGDYDAFEHHLRMMSGPTKEKGNAMPKWGPKMEAELTREADRQLIRTMTAGDEFRRQLESAIMATPTSERRNLLTEINMNLMMQKELLEKALALRIQEGG